MNVTEVKHTLRGPMIPVITNLNRDLTIDHAAIRSNVEYVVERGISKGQGVLLAGGAGGDFPMLTLDERKAVARTIYEASNGTPVLVGAQDTNLDVMIEMARYAEDIGAYGIQSSPTYYYASSDEDCLRVFQALHEATRRIAIMAYNTHWEGYNMSLDQIGRLCELERVVSLKWSAESGSTLYLRGLAKFADRLAVVDNQGLHVMNRMMGGTGYITHLATVWPEHDTAVWQLLETGQYEVAQQKISAANWPWSDFRGKMWQRTAAESPVVKAALELCGRPGGPSRLPTRSLNGEERAELHEILKVIGVPNV
ncbi:MAG: dihydrodipicolinate synthase family protein [Planctomycetota bacterium]|nr:dihydrodipicolinate synthase family protein [Planctomycetota bacterium]